jgi:hypothetical protein
VTVPDAIFQALEHGVSVIPLRPDKKPFVPWKQFQSQPATKEQAEAWAVEYDPPLWALVTGKVSNYVVIDFDGETGNETMRKLGLDPHFRTPSGGHHVYVKYPGWKIQTLNSKAQKEIAKEFSGMDIRADGGYAAFLEQSAKGEYVNLRSLRQAYRFEELPERLRKSKWLSPPAPVNGNHRPAPTVLPDTGNRVSAERLIRKALDEAHAGGRNNGGFWLAAQLRDNGYSQSEAESIVLNYQRRTPATNQKGEPEPYTHAETLASVRGAYSEPPREGWTKRASHATPPPAEPEPDDDYEDLEREAIQAEAAEADERPLIQVQAGELAQHVRDAERYLAQATRREPPRGVYQRHGFLVRIARLAETTDAGGIRRAAGTLQILTAGPDVLSIALADACRWLKWNQRSGEWVPADVPPRVAKTLCAIAGDWHNTPYLAGIIEAPSLRPDGSILQQPGYDAQSGLYFDAGDTSFPTIPEQPSRAQAEAALGMLLEIVSGFPFIDDASRSVGVAMLMTPLIRHAVRAAPLTGITAPKMGSGKTLAAYLPAYIATGRPPALMSQADEVTEEKKRLLAVLLEGSIVSVIDNCERPLKSDSLCTILTEPTWSERVLGVNRVARVSTATTWIATGNALRIDGDLSSRTLLATIDPRCERPEEREFSVNLHETIPERRGELAAAVLTIVRAYLNAERVRLPVYGRFEQWSRFVREPLCWLGQADPCETRKAVESRDPVREQLSALAEAWQAAFGDQGHTVSEALDELDELEKQPSLVRIDNRAELETLRAAIRAVADEKGKPNSRRLGNFLSRHERRIEQGLCFEQFGKRQRAVVWRVVTA